MAAESKRTISKNQAKHVHDYIRKHYDRMQINFPKGYKDMIQKEAEARKLSISRLIIIAVCKYTGLPVPEYNPLYNPYEKDEDR